MKNTPSNNKQQNNSAKFTFFYLISLISLTFIVLSVGNIIFQIINKHVVDIINTYSGTYSASSLKFAIASLIIATPIYYLSVNQINKNLSKGKLAIDNGARRWLTYLILFVSSVVAIGWLIAILYSFLDGDLTIKFTLKTITALGLASIVASYYFFDIKREKIKSKHSNTIKYYFYATLAFIIITFVSGLFFVESPKQTRQRKLDNLTLEKFNRITNAINNFYTDNDRLPNNLQELTKDIEYLTNIDVRNAENSEIIEYKILEEKKYAICATFHLSNIEINSSNYNYFEKEWQHKAGYKCFSRKTKDLLVIPSIREREEIREVSLP